MQKFPDIMRTGDGYFIRPASWEGDAAMIVRENTLADKKHKKPKSFRDLLDAIEENHGYQVNAIMRDPKRSRKHIYK